MKHTYFYIAVLVLTLSLFVGVHQASATGCTGTGNCYWVQNATCVAGSNWNNTACWYTTSGGANFGGVSGGLPSITDNCIFDIHSASTSADTSVVNAATSCNSISFNGAAHNSNYDGTLTGSSAITASGSLTFSASMIRSYTGTITLSGCTSSCTVTNNQNGTHTASESLTFGLGATNATTYTFKDNYKSGPSAVITLTSGTIDASDSGANHTITVGSFSSSNANTRAITMGTGTWTLTGNNATIWNTGTSTGLTLTTGSPIVSNYSGATGTRTITGSTTASTSPDFNITGGTDTATITGGIRHLNFTGFAGTLSNDAKTVYGNLTFASGMTLTAGTNALTLAPTTGNTHTLTSNTQTLDFPVTVNGAGTTKLGDNLVLGSTRTLTLTSGTINANNKNVTAKAFSSANTNTRAILFGTGTWTLSGSGTAWDMSTSTGASTTPSTSTIELTDATSSGKTFAGGGLTYYNLYLTGSGTGAYTISGNNTFNDFKVDTPPHTVDFTAGTTNTVTTFTVNGNSSNQITLNSTSAGSPFTLAAPGSTIDVNYLTIQDSTANVGLWRALLSNGNINSGNNSGWVFSGSARHNTGGSTSSTPTPTPTPTPILSATPTPYVTPTTTPTPTPVASNAPVTLIRYANDPKVYAVQPDGTKYWIQSPEEFNANGYKWSDIQVLPAQVSSNMVFTHFLSIGSVGAEVRALQQKLKDLGFLPSAQAATGYFGTLTAKAVKLFQSAHNLPSVGYVGPATRAALNQ